MTMTTSSRRVEITRGSSSDATVKVAHGDDDDGGRSVLSSWVKRKLLGRGANASVYLATRENDDGDMEVRAIKTAELSRASSLMNEGRILIRLDSPFLVRCYDAEIVREENCMQYNLILEYFSGQTIADLIDDNHGGGLLESDVKVFARDVLSGLKYIHDCYIVHCDIKPENLLLCPADRRFRPNGYFTKIGDFGLALQKGSIEYGDGYGLKRGTKRYMAPELIIHGIVDFGADVWALGCTVLEMLTGDMVWGEHGDLGSGSDDWVEIIGYSGLTPQIPDFVSEEAKDFLRRCFERDPHKRWSSHSLAKHPFAILW